ncbi:MAG: hypothetical protein SFY80_09280 [Verrucomicrobiota bacterium]|nr:hypothetical protein [Verrucomicrobiota bacterium]
MLPIIFNNRAYSNYDGQTWNDYETPLPADCISYADGVFEYAAAPSDTNGLTAPVRAHSTDQGKTWQSVGFTEACQTTRWRRCGSPTQILRSFMSLLT